jgi:hypothetical protein
MTLRRSPTVQTLSWFINLYRNNQLDLSPSYQRLSFWNDSYREFFVDSLLNDFPTSTIFIYQQINDAGQGSYHVVDGKQRLETIIAFINNEIQVPDSYSKYTGLYFSSFSPEDKRRVWDYQLSVETLPDASDAYLKQVFDRINRNVAKLKPQELRHAKFDGLFIGLSERIAPSLLIGFPNISTTDKRRMRDIEYVSTLLVFLIQSEKSTSQADLDRLYSEWDDELPVQDLEARYNSIHQSLVSIATAADGALQRTRFRNLADYYSLFGSLSEIDPYRRAELDPVAASAALCQFAERVEMVRQEHPIDDPEARGYYEAVRSASNDPGPRRLRIDTIKEIIGSQDV